MTNPLRQFLKTVGNWCLLEDDPPRYDEYRENAIQILDRARNRHGYSHKHPQRAAIGMDLAREIPALYKQGGERNYRYALALWQIGNALYSEYVTEEHYPKLTDEIWKYHTHHS